LTGGYVGCAQEAVRMRDQVRRLMALQEARATEGVAEV
jgi:hypothetical protein